MVCEEVLQKRIGQCQTQQYPTVQGKTFGFCLQKNRKGEEFRHEHVYMVTDLSCKMRIYPKLGFPGNRFRDSEICVQNVNWGNALRNNTCKE